MIARAFPPPVVVPRKGNESTARLLAGTGSVALVIRESRRPHSYDARLALEMIADGRVTRGEEEREAARRELGTVAGGER